MAEKGGKAFSLSNSKGKKASTGKSGKETNLSKHIKKKVHFSSSSDSDSDGSRNPIPTPSSGKGGKSNGIDYGKGGKSIGGDKAGGGVGVSTAVKPPPVIPKFDIEIELPKNTKCMMDCEAKDALEKIQEHLVILSEDPTIKLPESFHKGLNYAKSAGGYTDLEEVRRVLEVLKRKNNVSESEICLIANICPESSDEVFALLAELKAKRKKTERAIEDVLGDLIQLRSNKD